MNKLNLNPDTCIRCGKCVRICTSRIFKQENPKGEIQLVDPQNCISCGHCVAICPTDSIQHEDFPAEKVFDLDRSHYPTVEQLETLIAGRRSNRAFSSEEIPSGYLDRIVKAATFAPTAMNTQQVGFVVITQEAVLKSITEFTLQTFASAMKKLENPVLKPILKAVMPENYALIPKFKRMRVEYGQGVDLVLRKAKAVILFYASKKSRFGCQDSNLAYQNASLMAECLGVNHFYTGFVYSAMNMDKSDKFIQSLGIPAGNRVFAGMALGMPAFQFPRYMEKRERTKLKI